MERDYSRIRLAHLPALALASSIALFASPSLEAQPCPCTIWENSTIPTVESSNGTTPIELGVRFRADQNGYIKALRFYKGALNTGTHVGSLWADDGTLLAQVTFQNETASGWQEQELATPVAIVGGVTYIASYHTTVGRYAFDSGFFGAGGVTNGPLHANQNGDGGTNGLYADSATPTFPASSYNASNYWVDVVFDTSLVDTTPPTVTAMSPASGATDIGVGTTVSATFSEDVDWLTIVFDLLDDQSQPVVGSTSYHAGSRTVTFTPSLALADSTTYTASVSGATDLAGNAMPTPHLWIFMTAFPDTTPPTVVSKTPWIGEAGVSTLADVTVTFDENIDAGTLVFELKDSGGGIVAASVTYDAGTLTATLVPASNLLESETYTATLSVSDPSGNALTPSESWSFTTSNGAFSCPCSLWDDTFSPASVGVSDINPVELGVRFRAAVSGYITAIRFHKAPTNAGLHTGSIWLADGTPLASVTFQNETPDGWQEQLLDTPLAITAGTTYIVSYHAPNGNYSLDSGYFDGQGRENGPLRALADGEDGQQGVYIYNVDSTFPSFSFGSSNYWVDVVFQEELGDDQPPFVTVRSPFDGETDVEIDASIKATFNEEINPATLVIELKDSAGAPVAFTSSYDATFSVVTITPSALLQPSETYTATIVTVNDLIGNSMAAPSPWSFTTVPPDVTPPIVSLTVPAASEIDVSRVSNVSARFDERIFGTGLSFTLVDGQGAPMAGVVTYDENSQTVTFDPELFLDFSSTYTATVNGAEDISGNVMTTSHIWSFTTVPPNSPPPSGPGGPILVVADSANPFGRYIEEILLSEGRNLYLVDDISNVNLAYLQNYELVILGEMPLSISQASMFSSYVYDGGRLIAMRPDSKLSGLFGLTQTGFTLANAYLEIDSNTSSGAGLVSESIQYHSEADLYDVSSASVIATIFSDATTATTHPAVTTRNVGSNGGIAAAFTFDLAKSIVYTRQGNPAWVGQERDNFPGLRMTDLFIGTPPDGSPPLYPPEPDWLDLDKSHIPQADEQQRLLVHMIVDMLQTTMPLPRFWYLPSGHRAAVVMTGDDHAHGGTIPRFADYVARSDPGCSVDDWECIRGTSYIYASPGWITDAEIALYQSFGFEIAIHFDTACLSVPITSLEAAFTTQIAEANSIFPSMNPLETNRMHCVIWKGWIDTAKVQLQHGIRLDTNYYHDPETWIANYDVAFVTGSALPQRFADLDGTTIDSYQVHTHMNDETGQTFPATVDGFLDGAIGPNENYGVFCANMHTDFHPMLMSDQVVQSAQARGVPVVSSKQMLDWLDGRNNSSFQNIVWNGSTLSFGVLKDAKARNLEIFLPTNPALWQVVSVTRDGSPVTHTIESVKGRQQVVVDGETGSYVVTYQLDTTPPVITNVDSAVSNDDLVTISWTTDEPASTIVHYGTDSANLDTTLSDLALSTSHAVVLDSLLPTTQYFFRVESVDFAGNSRTDTEAPAAPHTFTTGDPTISELCIQQTTFADFSSGAHTGTAVTNVTDGEIELASVEGSEFDGTSLPSGWSSSLWGASGSVVVSGGIASVDAALLATDQLFDAGQVLEFVATFSGAEYQHAGFAIAFTELTWAMFSTGTGGQLLARTATPGMTETSVGSSFLGAPHLFRIEWNTSTIDYYVDGALVASHNATISAQMRPVASDYREAQGTLLVDSMHLAQFVPSGTYDSPVFDAGFTTPRGVGMWNSTEPAGTAIDVYARLGDTPTPDGSWTPFNHIPTSGGALGGSSRYLQYRVTLSSTDTSQTPVLEDITFTCTTPPVINGLVVTPQADGVSATVVFSTDELTNVVVDFGTSPSNLDTQESGAGLNTQHSVLLTGLSANTDYFLRVTATDRSGSTATEPAPPSAPLGFTTLPLPPDLGPTITSVVATPAVDGISATVTWTTSFAADSRVDFGLNAALLDQSVSSATLVTSHSLVLTGLTNDTTYHFRVSSAGVDTDVTVEPEAPAAPLSFVTPPEPDVTPPVISSLSLIPGVDVFSVTVTWATDEPAESRIDYGTSPTTLNLSVEQLDLVMAHSLDLTGLSPVTTYYYRVTSVDLDGNAATEPPVGGPAASFTTPELPPGTCLSDTLVSDFAEGSLAGVEIAAMGDGEVALLPTIGEDFSGSDIPAGWLETMWSATGVVNVVGGEAVVDGAMLAGDTLYPAGRSLEFVATFDGSAYQHVGFAITFSELTWAIFSTGGGGQIQCRTASPAMVNTEISSSYLGSPHTYRIEWNVSSVDFFVDGTLVSSHAASIGASMRPVASHFFAGPGTLSVSSMRMTPYTSSGSLTSRVFDGGNTIAWDSMVWTSDEPASTNVTMYVRYGDTPVPDATWTDFVEVPSSGSLLTGSSRYLQYRADLSTTDGSVTPSLSSVEILCPHTN